MEVLSESFLEKFRFGLCFFAKFWIKMPFESGKLFPCQVDFKVHDTGRFETRASCFLGAKNRVGVFNGDGLAGVCDCW